MKNFALIGVAGYIAPRHIQAIKETGNNLIAIFDPSDSVGIIDRYFPEADYFREYERFDRHLEKLRRNGQNIDYVSIYSPNFLHDAHIRFGLRHKADIPEEILHEGPSEKHALDQLLEHHADDPWLQQMKSLEQDVLAMNEGDLPELTERQMNNMEAFALAERV